MKMYEGVYVEIHDDDNNNNDKKLNSVALVRKQTILTE
jgi:hypothetical protein